MNPADLQWTEHPANPLINPPFPYWMIGDPTVLLPHETPDGTWRMIANTIPPALHEFVSNDGVIWRRTRTFCRGAMRPYVRRFDGVYHLYYEQIRWALPMRSRILHRTSTDLKRWSCPDVALRPHLPWHGRLSRTTGNPCVVQWCGEWLLYYSAATVLLRDCGFVEPAFIGVARASSPDGPWCADSKPLFCPSPGDPFRNLGAGSLKVAPDEEDGVLWGFNNGIYRDAEGRSRSSVAILRSDDGTNWTEASGGPFLRPSPGWKEALVYALDVRRYEGEWRVYFNARDGWFVGKERIGLTTGRSP